MSTKSKTAAATPVATAPVADTAAQPAVVDVPAPTGAEPENPVPATNRDTPVLIKGAEPEVTPQKAADVVQLAQAPEVPTVKVEVTTPEAPKMQGETVKVKFLRSHPSFGYFAGAVAEISKAAFEKYSQDGPFFEEIGADTPPTDGPKERKQTR